MRTACSKSAKNWMHGAGRSEQNLSFYMLCRKVFLDFFWGVK